MDIGINSVLKASREMPQGWYLIDEYEEEVLLPNAYVPKDFKEGQEIDVFLYLDFDERIVATTLQPAMKLYEFAYLECMQVNKVGAFMNWGLQKQLFVPFVEQKTKLEEGHSYLIYLDYDEKTDRLYGSNKEDQFLYDDEIDLERGQEVDLLVYDKSELGMKAIINNKFSGLIFNSDIHQQLLPGKRCKGYVKLVREDGKIDLSLQPLGYKLSIDKNCQILLDAIESNDGFLALTDKSPPDEIKIELGLSKKAFKRAVGSLYKQKMITLENEGLKLNTLNLPESNNNQT